MFSIIVCRREKNVLNKCKIRVFLLTKRILYGIISAVKVKTFTEKAEIRCRILIFLLKKNVSV